MDTERVLTSIAALLFLIIAIRKAQRFRFLTLCLHFERKQCDLTNTLLATRLMNRLRERYEYKLWQDGGEDEIYISSLPRIEREVVTHTAGSRRLRAKKSNSLELARYLVHAFRNSKYISNNYIDKLSAKKQS